MNCAGQQAGTVLFFTLLFIALSDSAVWSTPGDMRLVLSAWSSQRSVYCLCYAVNTLLELITALQATSLTVIGQHNPTRSLITSVLIADRALIRRYKTPVSTSHQTFPESMGYRPCSGQIPKMTRSASCRMSRSIVEKCPAMTRGTSSRT